ncbi:MAG: hypothetical protein WDM88_07005 [Galbitalea sp.]
MIRRATLLAVALGGCVALAGCASTAIIPTPSPAAIIGTWRHGSDTLTIDADGTFSLRNIPKSVIEQAPVARGAQPGGPSESVTGTWSIGSGGTDAGGAPGVQLDFVHPRKVGFDYGLTLIVAGTSPERLYVNLGRPDTGDRYNFTRR